MNTSSENKIREFAAILKESRNIVFFGGAGVSTESGIPDFRSADGIYSEKWHRTWSPEEIISHSFYYAHPEEFWTFYREKLLYPDVQPNDCHKALALLERAGKLAAVVTQNIDGLHQKAGSENVLELHGSVLRNYCERCRTFYSLEDILPMGNVPVCPVCGSRIKPDVVLYEEGLDQDILNRSVMAIRNADTLIIGGTSLVVYPAAGLVHYFRGKNLVLLNKSATSMDSAADLVIREPIGEVFRAVMREIRL
ncbi:MAG: NAD-dependent protein deacylase [Lachnospiraceae bacterium]|nr:NAD-dependent protein deacylase [Lachnospiraceae bacterium]